MKDNHQLKLNNKWLFVLVLLGSLVGFYLVIDLILSYFPIQWGWQLQYTVGRGLNKFSVNSAFFMFSAITSIFAAMYVTDGIRRGFKNTMSAKSFLLPLGVALLLELVFHEIENARGPFSVTALHTGLLVSWLLSLYVIRLVRLKITSGSN